MFRGAGIADGVSKFFPVRIGDYLFLRGANNDGVLYGYPYRDGLNLYARTITGVPNAGTGCLKPYMLAEVTDVNLQLLSEEMTYYAQTFPSTPLVDIWYRESNWTTGVLSGIQGVYGLITSDTSGGWCQYNGAARGLLEIQTNSENLYNYNTGQTVMHDFLEDFSHASFELMIDASQSTTSCKCISMYAYAYLRVGKYGTPMSEIEFRGEAQDLNGLSFPVTIPMARYWWPYGTITERAYGEPGIARQKFDCFAECQGNCDWQGYTYYNERYTFNIVVHGFPAYRPAQGDVLLAPDLGRTYHLMEPARLVDRQPWCGQLNPQTAQYGTPVSYQLGDSEYYTYCDIPDDRQVLCQ